MGFQNAANRFTVRFAGGPDASPLLTLVLPEGTFHLDPLAAKIATPTVEGNRILYPQVRRGIDLSYAVQSDGVKGEIVITKRHVVPISIFRIAVEGLQLEQAEGGEIEILDEESGALLGTLPLPIMRDANGQVSDRVRMRVLQLRDRYVLTLLPDVLWLIDPQRAFPVVVDPTINLVDGSTGGYLARHDDTVRRFLSPTGLAGWSFGERRIGKPPRSQARVYRTWLAVDTSSLVGPISDAQLEVAHATTWSTQGGFNLEVYYSHNKPSDVWDPAGATPAGPIYGSDQAPHEYGTLELPLEAIALGELSHFQLRSSDEAPVTDQGSQVNYSEDFTWDANFPARLVVVYGEPRVESFTLIEQALQAGLITMDQAAEYKVYAIFGSPRLPEKYRSALPIPGDGTALFLEAVRDWESLSAETQQRINDYITPKDVATASRVAGWASPLRNGPIREVGDCRLLRSVVTTHFRVHYTTEPTDACRVRDITDANENLIPDFVEDLGVYLEHSWSQLIESMGYREPSLNAEGRYDVNIMNLQLINVPGMTFPNWINIDNDVSRTGDPPVLKWLAAHEFYHASQWSYISLDIPNWILHSELKWWMEASAMWAQHEVVPNDTTYDNLLADYLGSPWLSMPRAAGVVSPGLAAYGSFIFATYLVEKIGPQSIVRETWEDYESESGGFGSVIPAIDNTLRTRGRSLAELFLEFMEMNYFLNYEARARFQNELTRAGLDGRPSRIEERQITETSPAEGPDREDPTQPKVVQYLGAVFVEFEDTALGPTLPPENTEGMGLRVTVERFPSADLRVFLYAVENYDQLLYQRFSVPVDSDGRATFQIDGFGRRFHRVTLAISNVDPFADLQYSYRAEVVPIIRAAVYTGGQFINASLDGGKTWRTTDLGSPVRAVTIVDGSGGSHAFVATEDLKLYETTDGGGSYTEIYNFTEKVSSFLPNPRIGFITVDPNDPLTLYVGVAHIDIPDLRTRGMLFRSTDGGRTFGEDLLPHETDNGWSQCGIFSMAIDPRDSRVLYIGQNGFNNPVQTIMKSTDAGETWVSITPGEFGFGGNMARRTWLTLAPNNPATIWVLTGNQLAGIWVSRSPQGGALGSWRVTKANNAFPQAAIRYALAVHPLSDEIAWISGQPFDLQVSYDGNLTWKTLEGHFDSLASLGAGNHLVAVKSGLLENDVFVSDDGGLTWTSIWQPGMGDNIFMDVEEL